MKKYMFVLIIAVLMGAYGCTGNDAKELFDVAELEELQNSHDHARELYGKVITRYPDSEYAEKAKKKLAAMQEKK